MRKSWLAAPLISILAVTAWAQQPPQPGETLPGFKAENVLEARELYARAYASELGLD